MKRIILYNAFIILFIILFPPEYLKSDENEDVITEYDLKIIRYSDPYSASDVMFKIENIS